MELEGFRFSEEPKDIEKDSNIQYVVTFPTYKDCKKKNEEKECIGESNICVYCYYSSFLILMANQLPSKRKAFVEYQVGWRTDKKKFLNELHSLLIDNEEFFNKSNNNSFNSYSSIINSLNASFSDSKNIKLANTTEGPTKKLQIWQLILAAFAILAMVSIAIWSKSDDHKTEPNKSTEKVSKTVAVSEKPITPKSKKETIDKYQTNYLSGYSTIELYQEDLFITLNDFIEYSNSKFELKINTAGNKSITYDSLSLGDTFLHENYEVKIFDLKHNVSTYTLILKTRQLITKNELVNSKWYFDVTQDCRNYYNFYIDSVIIYDCEIPERIYGTYNVNDETISIKTIRSEFDKEFDKDSRHRHKPRNINLSIWNSKVLVDELKTKYKRE